jgi:hypothetical protein
MKHIGVATYFHFFKTVFITRSPYFYRTRRFTSYSQETSVGSRSEPVLFSQYLCILFDCEPVHIFFVYTLVFQTVFSFEVYRLELCVSQHNTNVVTAVQFYSVFDFMAVNCSLFHPAFTPYMGEALR